MVLGGRGGVQSAAMIQYEGGEALDLLDRAMREDQLKQQQIIQKQGGR